jgi:hypothetical protein
VAKKFLQLAGPTKNFRNNLPNEANFHRRKWTGNPQRGWSSTPQLVQVITTKINGGNRFMRFPPRHTNEIKAYDYFANGSGRS